MRKAIFLIFLTEFLFLPFFITARSGCPEGLVPCGTESCPCTFCDFFVMLDRILDFVVFKMVPIVAVLMLMIGGGMFFFSAEDTTLIQKGKSLIKTTIIGIVIVYGAFLIVGTFLNFLGLADWTQEIYKNWWEKGFFEINCE